jgi:UDP-N-acetylmuramate dehydrogenase
MSLAERLPFVESGYRENYDLAKINWFQVGGKAEVMFRPQDREELGAFLRDVPSDVPITILGVGSNVIVRDCGIKGVVIRLGREFAEIKQDSNNIIEAGSSALDVNVATFAKNMGLAGLEFLVGIPGTIGGALKMNAGAYGGEVKDIMVKAEAFDKKGRVHMLNVDDMNFAYRTSKAGDYIFTRVWLKGKKGDVEEIADKMAQIKAEREVTQPIKSRTGGSTFKNPKDHKAWELIDKAGCRGLKQGGAQISELHCNFMINNGGATATDLESLGEEVRKRVLDKTGVELEWEIKFLGTN